MNTDNIREDFEDWYFDECVDFAERREVFQTFSNSGDYSNMAVADAWMGYQAAHAASEKRIAELEEMIESNKYGLGGVVEGAVSEQRIEALQADNKRLLRAVQVMVDDGWLYHGDEGMSEAQAEVYETWKALSPTESLEDK